MKLKLLFGSKARFKILTVFLENMNKGFYVRQLQRLTSTQLNSVRREIEVLAQAGIIREQKREANKIYYTAIKSRNVNILRQLI